MFVIPCKYNPDFPFVIQLVDDIRKYHKDEKIVVVDSDSDDKSYLESLKDNYNVIIEDISNKNWMVGAYWYTYKKYPNEEFYYFIHDSMRVKGNMDYLKEKELTIIMNFPRNISDFNSWGTMITKESKYEYEYDGKGCYGSMFLCKNKVMKRMLYMGADKFLPSNKLESGYCEGAYGFFLEEQGYDLDKCSLYGDVLEQENSTGKSGHYPHKTNWQFPIEKFYASQVDINRSWKMSGGHPLFPHLK